MDAVRADSHQEPANEDGDDNEALGNEAGQQSVSPDVEHLGMFLYRGSTSLG